jgi:hypothetical protein
LLLCDRAWAADDIPAPLHDDLLEVRVNHELLGTPLCIFVGYFPNPENDDWAKEQLREKEIRSNSARRRS